MVYQWVATVRLTQRLVGSTEEPRVPIPKHAAYETSRNRRHTASIGTSKPLSATKLESDRDPPFLPTTAFAPGTPCHAASCLPPSQ